jgi:hypothetical protein
MDYEQEILFLNEQHFVIVDKYLNDVTDLVYNSTFFNEDYVGFQSLIDNVITFHNGLGKYCLEGTVEAREWYISLPNNLYWAAKGYFNSLLLYQNQDIEGVEEKLLYLTISVLEELNESIDVNPSDLNYMNINLN